MAPLSVNFYLLKCLYFSMHSQLENAIIAVRCKKLDAFKVACYLRACTCGYAHLQICKYRRHNLIHACTHTYTCTQTPNVSFAGN